MATKGKMFWIIGGVIVLAGGIGAYFLLKKPKDATENKKRWWNKDKKQDVNTDDVRPIPRPSYTPPRIVAPSELNTRDKILSFQRYVLNVKKDNSILGRSGADGIWGSNSQNAWNRYGGDYLRSLESSPSGGSTTTTSPSGGSTTTTSPSGSQNDFSTALSNAKKDGKTAFIWANQVHRTSTGKRVLEWNPRLYNLYSTTTGNKLRESASSSSKGFYVQKDQSLGKGGGVAFSDNYLYIWLPDKKRWIASIYVSRTKPSFVPNIGSNFDGSNNEITSFDKNFDILF